MTTQHSVTVLASLQRTASENSVDQNGRGARGIHLVLDITVDAGGTLDVKLQRKDPLSGKYVDIPGASFPQQSGVGTTELTVFPGIAETANVSVSDVLSEVWRAVATMATSPDMTFSLAGSYVP